MKEPSQISIIVYIFAAISDEYVLQFPHASSPLLYFIVSCFIRQRTWRHDSLFLSQNITAFLVDAIKDVIYHEAATRGLITSPATKTNSQSRLQTFRAFEKSRRIRHRCPDSVAVIYIPFNEDRCVPRAEKHISFLSAIIHKKCDELIIPQSKINWK